MRPDEDDLQEKKKLLAEKQAITLINKVGNIVLICIIVSGMVSVGVYYIKIKRAERLIGNILSSNVTPYHNKKQTLNSPPLVDFQSAKQPKVSIQSKTYKNGALVDKSKASQDCIYNNDKKVCLD